MTMREQENPGLKEDPSTLSADDIGKLVSEVLKKHDRYGTFNTCTVYQAHSDGLETVVKIYLARPQVLLVEIKAAGGGSKRPVVRVFHPHGRKALPRYLSLLLEQLTGESFDMQKPADIGETGSLRATLSKWLSRILH